MKLGQWSLLALLIATAVLPVAIYALVRATPLIASIVLTLVCLAWLAAVIVWFSETGERQAVARGFAIAAFAYGFTIWYVDPNETFHTRALLTTQLLRMAHEGCKTQTQVPASSGRRARTITTPDLTLFMRTGQIYWSAMLGLAGGYFARWVYRRRKQRELLSAMPDGQPTDASDGNKL